MKKLLGLIGFTVVMASFSPAYSQDSQQPVSNTDIQHAVDQALRSKFSAGDPDATVVDANGNVVPASSANGDKQEVKKVYRYNKKKGFFDGVPMPKRTFNNIQYPY